MMRIFVICKLENVTEYCRVGISVMTKEVFCLFKKPHVLNYAVH